MLSLLKNNKNLLVLSFFSAYFIIGILIFDDFGISIDEDNTRINGLVALKYLFELLSLDQTNLFNSIPSIKDWKEKGIGYIFDLPTAYIEYLFKIEDTRQYFLMRHLINFSFFYIASVYFYFLIKNRYKSIFFALLGTLFLILSPRIFAESFYNNKDLIFLSLFIISTFYSINFIENPSSKSAILFALFSSLSIGIRVIGIVLPLIIFIIYIINILRNENNKSYFIKNLFIFFIFLILFTIIFYPFLWDDPIRNFLQIFSILSNFDIGIFNFYLGNYISAESLPWHYSLVWLFVTTPIFYLFLFFIGITFILTRFFSRLIKIDHNNSYKDLWRGNKELQDLLHLFIFFIPIFSIIILHSTLYDGWRHLYFIYPSFLMVSLSGLNIIIIKFFKNKKLIPIILSLILIIPTFTWMIKNHPHQYVFFNSIFKNNYDKYFTMDFWGVSNFNAMMYVAQNNEGNIIVSNLSNSDLELTKKFLPQNLRDNIVISGDLKNSDFLFNNFIFWGGIDKVNKEFLDKNFTKYYELKVNNVSINTIYKNTNK